jgi:hypothetical protein
MASPPIFCHDTVRAFLVIKQLSAHPTLNSANQHLMQLCATAQVLETTFYERDQQLYYEGLLLSDRYGDAFDRNLTTEIVELEQRD